MSSARVLTATTLRLGTTADGGANLFVRTEGSDDEVILALNVSQTNVLLRGLLNVATVEIKPEV